MQRFHMGLIRKLILIFPVHLVFLCNRFCRQAHIQIIIRIIGRNRKSGNNFPARSWNHRHAFSATGDNTFCLPAPDFGGSNRNGFQVRSRNSGLPSYPEPQYQQLLQQ